MSKKANLFSYPSLAATYFFLDTNCNFFDTGNGCPTVFYI